MNIYLCGHGSWTKSGFATLPKSTTISFYAPMGRYLEISQLSHIVAGHPSALSADQVFQDYALVTDMTLHPAPALKSQFLAATKENGAKVVTVDKATRLAVLLTVYAGNDLHWCACRPRLQGRSTDEGGYNDDFGLPPEVMTQVDLDTIRSGSQIAIGKAPSELERNAMFKAGKERL